MSKLDSAKLDHYHKRGDSLANRYRYFGLPPFGSPRIRAVKKEKQLCLWDWSAVAALLEYIRASPEFKGLRPDPQFQDLLRRLNLADDQVAGSST